MKSLYIITLAATLTTGFSQQDPDEVSADPGTVGDLPISRMGETLPPNALSPYGLPKQKKAVKSTTRQYSQEDQIREILRSLRVTGVIGNGKKVLLHNIILEEGEIIQNVLRNQTEVLLVKAITPQKVYIEWIEQTRRSKPRTMEILIDMSPRVEAIIPGQKDNVGTKAMGIVRMRELADEQ